MITRKRLARNAASGKPNLASMHALLLALLLLLISTYISTYFHPLLVADALFIDGSRCDCVVKTAQGPIQGKMVKLSKTERVFLFLGIPYAAAPIDKLKNGFASSVPHRGWNDTFDAAEFGPICPSSPYLAGPPCIMWSNTNPRLPFTQSVDCLTLNVYTPDLKNSRLPVLVFIHGGSYVAGAGAFLPGEKLAAVGSVVVTLNYRLGAYGFLQGEKEVPGNMAIHDIILALRWVQQNVRAFGGDPERVCLVGHSAGAALVMAIMLYKNAEGLFQSVSLQSGSILAPWALQRDPKAPFQAMVRTVKCGAAKNAEVCLNSRSLDHGTVVTQSRRGASKFYDIDFAPTIDGEIITAEPRSLIGAGAITNVPVMISVTKDEASEILYRLGWQDRIMHINQTLSSYHQRTLVKLLTENGLRFHHPEIIAEALKFHYFDSKPHQSATTARDGYVRLLTDSLFTSPAIETADLLSNNNFTVYFWVFDYHNNNDTLLPAWTGAYHGLELKYQLGCPFAPKDNVYNRTIDRVLSNLLMQMLINFAKSGVPIGSNDLTHQIHWFPYDSTRGNYLNISASLPHQNSHFQYGSVHLWNGHVPELDEYKPTYAPTAPPQQHADYRVLTFLMTGIALLFAVLFFIMLSRMYCCYDEDEPDRDAEAMAKVEEILPRAPMQEPIQAPDPIYYGSDGIEPPPARPAMKEVYDPVLPVA